MSGAGASSVTTAMHVEIGEQIVRWTARLAVAAYGARLISDVIGPPDEPAQRTRRERFTSVIWTLGCIAYLLHVAAAFHFVHDWSHAAAAEHTARQTAAVTGWHWGGGLWINYAFTLWWPLDVVWSWRRGLDLLPRPYVVGMHVIVGFLMFNATAVFGPPAWRWIAGLVIGILACLTIRRRARTYIRTDASG